MRPFTLNQRIGLRIPIQPMRRTRAGLKLPRRRWRDAVLDWITGLLRPRPAAQFKSVREPCYTHALVGAVVAVLIVLWAMGVG